MACFLTEDDVQQLLPMSRAIECVEASFADQHTGAATNQPRRRIFLPGFSLHYMAGALAHEHWVGMKVYTVTANQARFLVLLFDAQSGDLLALVEADHLGRIRTGAASGVATRCLARPDASQVGLIGSGRRRAPNWKRWRPCVPLRRLKFSRATKSGAGILPRR